MKAVDASLYNGVSLDKVTTYDYDLSGLRTREKTTQAGVTAQDNHLAYDTLGRLRGAGVQLASCQKLGAGEGERVYAVSLPGRVPFGLTVFQRTAPTGDAWSFYSATAKLDGRPPARGSTADCDF